jgi:hypothetical protein
MLNLLFFGVDSLCRKHIGDRSVAARLKERKFERIPYKAPERT